MKQMTFKQYRNIDLGIWTFIVVLFEMIATMASTKWFSAQPVTLSITVAMICVLMLRWSHFSIIHAFAGGVAYCLASGATMEQFIIYCLGNTVAMIGLGVIKLWGKEEIRTNSFKRMIFALAVYIGAVSGRWLVSLVFKGTLEALMVYFTTDIVSLLFAVLVLMILSNSDGMIEDQKHYLLRLDKEKRESM